MKNNPVKYSDVGKLKIMIMQTLEKSVDNILDQWQANAADESKDKNIVPLFFDAALVVEFSSNTENKDDAWVIFCNPFLNIFDYNTSCAGNPNFHNYSHKIMNEHVKQLKEDSRKISK